MTDTAELPRLVVQTNGMGVDSAAWLTAVLRGDMPAPFDLRDLVVVTAMTGDESDRTRWAMETHLLPLMREHGIRYVQVARAGRSETDGIEVLSDTRAPERMVMRGRVSLSDELLGAGTIPQVSNRTCSYRMKGWVLDTWLREEFGDTPRRHVVGFAAEERRRIERDKSYTTEARAPWYPLADDWGWDRTRCLAYLREVYGIEWPRSCCGFCPFQAGPDIARLGERWAAEPDQAALAVAMERAARALNPRMILFGDRSAEDVARGFGLGAAVDQAAAELDARPARLYEVRRIYRRAGDARYPGIDKTGERDQAGADLFECKSCGLTGDRATVAAHRLDVAGSTTDWVLGHEASEKGNDVWRSLRNLGAERTRAEAVDMLRRLHALVGGELEITEQGARLWFERAGAPYPAVEHYIAVGVAGVADKERGAFDELWDFVAGLGLDRQGDLFTALGV
jgi:hypothetical protein